MYRLSIWNHCCSDGIWYCMRKYKEWNDLDIEHKSESFSYFNTPKDIHDKYDLHKFAIIKINDGINDKWYKISNRASDGEIHEINNPLL